MNSKLLPFVCPHCNAKGSFTISSLVINLECPSCKTPLMLFYSGAVLCQSTPQQIVAEESSKPPQFNAGESWHKREVKTPSLRMKREFKDLIKCFQKGNFNVGTIASLIECARNYKNSLTDSQLVSLLEIPSFTEKT